MGMKRVLHQKCGFVSKARMLFYSGFFMKWSDLGVLSRSQYPWGKVSKWFWEKCEGKLDMPHLICNQTVSMVLMISIRWTFLRDKNNHKHAFATPNCLPNLLYLTFFLPFSLGAFELANPQQSSFVFFICQAYLNLSL